MKEQIKEILETLISATKNGSIQWKESNPNSKERVYKRLMSANGSDGTIFEIRIEYSLFNNVWKLENNGIWIQNSILPDGRIFVSNNQNKEVVLLRNLIIEKFCSDLDPKIEDVENMLSDICKGISISTLRDNKLNDLGI